MSLQMEIDSKEKYSFDDYLKFFHEILDKNKLKKTSERFNILREIYETDGHFNADTLFKNLRRKKYSVSKTTIYNTLELLESFQLIIKHHFGYNFAQYEKYDLTKPHDHIVIDNTGELFEFQYKIPNNIIKKLEEKYNISVSHHSLTLFAKKNNSYNHSPSIDTSDE